MEAGVALQFTTKLLFLLPSSLESKISEHERHQYNVSCISLDTQMDSLKPIALI